MAFEDLVFTLDDDLTSVEMNKIMGNFPAIFFQGISGFVISNGSDAVNDIDISVGIALGDDDDTIIRSAAAFSKQIDAVWTAGGTPGSPLGGFPSGLTSGSPVNDTWYHVFAIWNPTTGAVDAGFDSSVTATNLLSDATGFTKFRRIGSILYGTATIVAFHQLGDVFLWDVPVQDESNNDPGISSRVTVIVTVPLDVAVFAIIFLLLTDATPTSGAQILVQNPDFTDSTPTSILRTMSRGVAGAAQADGNLEILTDTSAQITYRINQSNTDINVFIDTQGWRDLRGRDS